MYSERSWTSKMEILKNFFWLFTIYTKRSILDVRLRSEYASGTVNYIWKRLHLRCSTPFGISLENIVNYFCKRLRSSHQWCSVRKSVLRNLIKLTGKHLCQSLLFNKVADLAQVFSCEFCEISKNTFSQNNSGWLPQKASS